MSMATLVHIHVHFHFVYVYTLQFTTNKKTESMDVQFMDRFLCSYIGTYVYMSVSMGGWFLQYTVHQHISGMHRCVCTHIHT